MDLSTQVTEGEKQQQVIPLRSGPLCKKITSVLTVIPHHTSPPAITARSKVPWPIASGNCSLAPADLRVRGERQVQGGVSQSAASFCHHLTTCVLPYGLSNARSAARSSEAPVNHSLFVLFFSPAEAMNSVCLRRRARQTGRHSRLTCQTAINANVSPGLFGCKPTILI